MSVRRQLILIGGSIIGIVSGHMLVSRVMDGPRYRGRERVPRVGYRERIPRIGDREKGTVEEANYRGVRSTPQTGLDLLGEQLSGGLGHTDGNNMQNTYSSGDYK